MKYFILIGLMICVFLNSTAQVVTIKNIETGELLEGVTLLSEMPMTFEVSNANGQVDVSPFKNSKQITVRRLGYKAIHVKFSDFDSLNYVLMLTPSQISMEEVVFTANRWSQAGDEIAGKVTSLSMKELELLNPQTSADLLATSGEVFIQKSQQGGGSPMIRGFSTNRLLYAVDGVRMNTAIFRSGNLQNVISLDPFSMEHVEVLFGPGAVIYGSDAIGGVMSFQTLTPQLSLTNDRLVKGSAETRFSSANNEQTAHFDINVGWKKWAMLSSISASDFGDLKMGSQGPDEYLRPFYVQRKDSTDVVISNSDPKIQNPSGYSQLNLMQKLRFKPSEKWDFQYGFHYSETSNYDRFDRHIRYKDGGPRYGEWYYGPQIWMMNNLSIQNNQQNLLYDQMTIRLAHQYFEESRISRDFNKPNRENRQEEVDAYSTNIDFNKSVGAKNEFFYGVELVYDNVVSKGEDENILTGSITPGASRYPKSTWASYAAYLTDHFKLSKKVSIQAGLRYNVFQMKSEFDTSFYPIPFTESEINNAAVTGSFGVMYHPGNRWNIRTNLSTGFRSPNVDDASKVFDSEPGSVVVPNNDLTAETAYNAEVGIAKYFGEALKIDATAYYTLLENAMVRRDYQLNGLDSIVYDDELSQVQAVQNAAQTTVYGVQFGMDLKLKSGFGISSRYNYQKGEEELDDGSKSPSRHAAPAFGTTRFSYEIGNLTWMIYAIYSAEVKSNEMPEEELGKDYLYAINENGDPYSPGWYTLNFKSMYVFTEYFSVSAGIENLTDIRYRPYSSGLTAPGRNFIFSVKASF